MHSIELVKVVEVDHVYEEQIKSATIHALHLLVAIQPGKSLFTDDSVDVLQFLHPIWTTVD